MGTHIRRHHKEIDLSGGKGMTQPTIPGSFNPRSTNNVGVLIALDMRPVSVVENAGFNHLISVLEPRYELPSRSHMTTKVKVLPAMYENVKARMNEGLSHAG